MSIDTAEPSSPLPRWIDVLRTTRRDLMAVFGVALLLRLVYFTQYAEALPFVNGPIADSIVYLEQAFHVRHGDLGAAVLLAFSPLYGYFLALIGYQPVTVPVVWQLLLGCLLPLVLYLTSFQLAGRSAARFTAALYLGYATLLYYESKILSETLSLWLGACALLLYVGDRVRRGAWWPSFASGVLFGLAILARASLVFAAPLLVLCALLPQQRERESLRVSSSRAAAVALGLALVFGGNGLITYASSGIFVPVILVSRTVEASSAKAFDGQLTSMKFGEGLTSSYDVVESAKQRIADVAAGRPSQPSSAARIDVLGWLRNAPSKTLTTLSPREITFQYGFNAERAHVSLLRVLPVSFGVLLLWGLIGAVLWARRCGVRALLPFAPLLCGVLVTTTLYHPSTRYRLAIVLPLLVLSGIGFDGLLRLLPPLRTRVLAAAGVATCVLMAIHLTSTRYNHAEFALQMAMSAGVGGDMDAQRLYAQQALNLAPNDPSVRQRALGLLRHASPR